MKVYLIRHAQSIYNIGEEEIHKKLGDDYLKSEEYLVYKYNQEWCDCGITELGVQQCLEAMKHMEHIPIDIVIVSPLRRALATC